MRLGEMQDWPLRVTRLVDHAEREHADGEIVTAWADGSVTRTTWGKVARDARKRAWAEVGERLGDSRNLGDTQHWNGESPGPWQRPKH